MHNFITILNLKRFFLKSFGSLLFLNLYQVNAFALTYQVPYFGNIIGEYKEITTGSGDTLTKLAQKYDIGVYEIVSANRQLHKKDLKPNTRVSIPAQFTLPSGPKEGIVLNLADMRLFYYHPNSNQVTTFPVGVGRQGWSTPRGTTQVVSKQKDPVWHPPASIRRESAQRGKTLPLIVPAGPHNPLGQYALHLGFSGILIHGTTQPASIGLQSSHGCIRLYPADIKELFYLVPIGTSVRIVYEPHEHE